MPVIRLNPLPPNNLQRIKKMRNTIIDFKELVSLDWASELKSSNIRDYIRTLNPVNINELPPMMGEIQFWLTLGNHDLIVLTVQEYGGGRSRISYTSRVPVSYTHLTLPTILLV